jgi:shikimate dehydrogenase
VIGDPVRQSLSPVLHNAAFAALGLDWVYVAFPVPAGSGFRAVAAMRTLGISGLSVTMPHKADAATAADELSPSARRLGVVNTLSLSRGAVRGDNTDGAGFVDALRQDEGWDPAGRTCLVLGAGGAARSVVLALAEAGAASVTVVGRRPQPVAECAALAGPAGRVGGIDQVGEVELVVNATPVGMGATPISGPRETLPLGLDPGRLSAGQLVTDLVYAPALTPLLAAARKQGAAVANGLGMLVHQAGRQLSTWTGQEAPLGAMSAAAMAALAHQA